MSHPNLTALAASLAQLALAVGLNRKYLKALEARVEHLEEQLARELDLTHESPASIERDS